MFPSVERLLQIGTGRHIYPWKRLADTLGADQRAVQRWYAQAIEIIAAKVAP